MWFSSWMFQSNFSFLNLVLVQRFSLIVNIWRNRRAHVQRLLCFALSQSYFSLRILARGFWERPVENSPAVGPLSPVTYRISLIHSSISANFSISICKMLWDLSICSSFGYFCRNIFAVCWCYFSVVCILPISRLNSEKCSESYLPSLLL